MSRGSNLTQPTQRSVIEETDGNARGTATPPVYDPLLTIDQVSHWLGKPKNTLYAWRTRGFGPRTVKVGGSVRYRRSDVEAFLDANTMPSSGR